MITNVIAALLIFAFAYAAVIKQRQGKADAGYINDCLVTIATLKAEISMLEDELLYYRYEMHKAGADATHSTELLIDALRDKAMLQHDVDTYKAAYEASVAMYKELTHGITMEERADVRTQLGLN